MCIYFLRHNVGINARYGKRCGVCIWNWHHLQLLFLDTYDICFIQFHRIQ